MENKELTIKVIPNASKNEIIKEGSLYKAKLTLSPEAGKANKMLIKLLSEYFNVSKSSIKIISGERSREKRISLQRCSQIET